MQQSLDSNELFVTEYRIRQAAGECRSSTTKGACWNGSTCVRMTPSGDRPRTGCGSDRVIQAVSQGIVITDPNLDDNPIIYASHGFERSTGYDSNGILGQNAGPEISPCGTLLESKFETNLAKIAQD